MNIIRYSSFIALFILVIGCNQLHAQRILTPDDEDFDHFAGRTDSVQKEDVPEGIYVWKVDERLGTILPTSMDTLSEGFQNDAFTEGRNGQYTTTGNLGAARYSRLYFTQKSALPANDFIFTNPYDFFLRTPEEIVYTNTKSPFTNLTYHECGNKTNGEDRFTAKFATNVNKRLGFGFIFDYLYGRGYYDRQANSEMNGTLFGTYIGERYQLHAHFSTNYLKLTENGGLEDDTYITNPEAFPTSYSTSDMPVRLSKTWNKMHLNTFYLTHRYNIGFHRTLDAKGRVVRTETANELLGKKLANAVGKLTVADSITATQPLTTDTIDNTLQANQRTNQNSIDSLQFKRQFVPVIGLVHTLKFQTNNRRFISNDNMNAYSTDYFNDFYLPNDSANDLTKFISVHNTFALDINEGFSKWVKSGLSIFAAYEFQKFSMPALDGGTDKWTRHFMSIGARLSKRQGHYFHYNVSGETRTDGSNFGEFFVHANADLNLPLWKDTLRLGLFGHIRNELPAFYYEHYHGRNAWWDNEDYKKIFSTRIGAELKFKDTKLTVAVEDLQNYIYFAETNNVTSDNLILYGVCTRQSSKNLQVISAQLRHKFHFGIFNWDSELTYQTSSDDDILPLPKFNVYSNFYIDFRIARVLQTKLGVDIRYFTKYYGLAYSPMIGQYAVQDEATRIKVGNYPQLNAYVNFSLKRTRFYVMASHFNHSSGTGYPFYVPHHPLNQMVLRLGISWNFKN